MKTEIVSLFRHGPLIIAFLGLSLVQKVHWVVPLEPPLPKGCQCIEIVLPPLPAQDDGWLRRAVNPKTQPASVIEGAETDLYIVTGYAVGDGYTSGEITADGRKVRPGITVACRLPLGTMVYIEGIGPRVCEDRGIGPPGVENWIDVAFKTPEAAIAWGKRWARVAVIQIKD